MMKNQDQEPPHSTPPYVKPLHSIMLTKKRHLDDDFFGFAKKISGVGLTQ